MSLSGSSAPHYPITPPTSLISDHEDDDMLTPITGNPAQFLPYTPNRHHIPIQLCQQITPIPDTPKTPTPENRGLSDLFRPYNTPNQLSASLLHNAPPHYHDSHWWITKLDIAPPCAAQWMGDRVFDMRKILWPSNRRNCCRLSQPDSTSRWNSTGTANQKKRFHWWHSERNLHFYPRRECHGCRLWQPSLLR